MTVIDLGPLPAEPVPLADLKSWCRIERDDEDASIVSLGQAARETIEALTRRILVRRAFRLVVDAVPADGWIEIERHPLRAVTGLTAYDASGAARVFGPGSAVVERALGIEAVRVSPEVRAAAVNGLEIEFEAGFEAGQAPEALKLALRRLVAIGYELRAVIPASQQPGLLPRDVEALLAPYRRVRI